MRCRIASVVICLERGADCLHMVQLMPLPSQNLIISCLQGRRQVKICGVDRHGERGARAYNWGLEAERPPYSSPCKNSSDLYQFQKRPLEKVGWTCPPQSTPWRRHCLPYLNQTYPGLPGLSCSKTCIVVVIVSR